jgi:hypothetical protein
MKRLLGSRGLREVESAGSVGKKRRDHAAEEGWRSHVKPGKAGAEPYGTPRMATDAKPGKGGGVVINQCRCGLAPFLFSLASVRTSTVHSTFRLAGGTAIGFRVPTPYRANTMAETWEM